MYCGLKDSGQRETAETGLQRDIRKGKGRFDLISPIFLRRLAVLHEKGALKYGERNWEKGGPLSRCLDSALRHINQFREGYRDEDHLVQACWNLMAIVHHLEMVDRGLLDRNYVDFPVYLAEEGNVD